MPVHDLSQQPRSWEGMGQLCPLNALPPSDLAHDLFPGANRVGYRVKDGCDSQRALVPEHKGTQVGRNKQGTPGYFLECGRLYS